MPTLIVTAHPDPDSLVQHLADRLVGALHAGTSELADLAAEGFDPRYTLGDRHTYRVAGEYTPDVAREQERLDRASDLVLVFPVYWWSMPALLKGWFDRVFVNGWAFGLDADGRIVRQLDRLRIHLVPVAGDDAGVYDRHGYEHAMRTQIEHGIVDFCGARRGVTAFVHDSEREDAEGREAAVEDAVNAVVAAIRA
ncbi:NAD(P)H-dependent oxidoreductase [Plantibacter sp. VKM Ac-2880]|uniref:NAD(P)H-dependent oxidoreductase n=1 Tax=Plantibacter sp. VKM Ac-2880 TaxID=2783827 RepID=UPI00188E647B|nr:NAD(P)H-dependent oxidoreductase [Plantibacter sp. VKM Ac-2880]